MNGAQRACAGRIHHAVGAAQIQPVADASGNHVAKKARKGILLPGHKTAGDALHDFTDLVRRQPGVFQGFSPYRVTQAGAQRNHQLLGSRNAENDAGAVAVKIPLRSVPRIGHGHFGRHQPQHLGAVRGLQDRGRYAEFRWIEFDGGQKTAPFAVNMIRRFGVRIKIILRRPVRRGNIGDGIEAVNDQPPESFGGGRFGKDAPDADNGDRGDPGRGGRIAINLCFSFWHQSSL